MTETPANCPNCQHPQHLPGTECDARIDHGPSRFHACLCLARPGAANACPPQMTCQGGTLGYADIWYLQQGHSLSSADGVISPEALNTGPVAVGFPSQADQTAVWIDGDPLMEAIASTVWEHCARDDKDMPHAVCDDPRTIAAWAAAVARSHAAAGPAVDQTAEVAKLRAALAEAEERAETDDQVMDAINRTIREQRAAINQVLKFAASLDETGRQIAGPDAVHPVAAHLRHLLDTQPAEAPQPTEAHPPSHRWYVETLDGIANEWAPGLRFTNRTVAVERYQAVSEHHPLWRDGTPVRRRFVRETTSYTVEPAPAVVAQPDEEARPRCPHCQLPHDLEPGSLPVIACQSIRQQIADAERSHIEGDHSLCRRVDCEVLRQS